VDHGVGRRAGIGEVGFEELKVNLAHMRTIIITRNGGRTIQFSSVSVLGKIKTARGHVIDRPLEDHDDLILRRQISRKAALATHREARGSIPGEAARLGGRAVRDQVGLEALHMRVLAGHTVPIADGLIGAVRSGREAKARRDE
jgi:hypothetical protein